MRQHAFQENEPADFSTGPGHGRIPSRVDGVRKEFQNDGLGTQGQSGSIDLSYHLAPFLHLYLESAMAQHATPTFRYMIWWTTPLQK